MTENERGKTMKGKQMDVAETGTLLGAKKRGVLSIFIGSFFVSVVHRNGWTAASVTLMASPQQSGYSNFWTDAWKSRSFTPAAQKSRRGILNCKTSLPVERIRAFRGVVIRRATTHIVKSVRFMNCENCTLIQVTTVMLRKAPQCIYSERFLWRITGWSVKKLVCAQTEESKNHDSLQSLLSLEPRHRPKHPSVRLVREA